MTTAAGQQRTLKICWLPLDTGIVTEASAADATLDFVFQ